MCCQSLLLCGLCMKQRLERMEAIRIHSWADVGRKQGGTMQHVYHASTCNVCGKMWQEFGYLGCRFA